MTISPYFGNIFNLHSFGHNPIVNNEPIIGNPYSCGGDFLYFPINFNTNILVNNSPHAAPNIYQLFVIDYCLQSETMIQIVYGPL